MSDRKRCTQCGKMKVLHAFAKCRDGVQSACARCRSIASAALNYPVSVSEKRCGTCGGVFAADKFYPNRRKKDGLQSHCKACTNARKRNCFYPVTLTEKTCRDCEQTKPASDFCRDKKRLGGLRSECRACTSVRNLATCYGIGREAVRGMRAVPACEICGGKFGSDADKNLDHCHRTGNMRGTLCWGCNKMLGNARDNPQVLRAGARYLKERAAGWGGNVRHV